MKYRAPTPKNNKTRNNLPTVNCRIHYSVPCRQNLQTIWTADFGCKPNSRFSRSLMYDNSLSFCRNSPVSCIQIAFFFEKPSKKRTSDVKKENKSDLKLGHRKTCARSHRREGSGLKRLHSLESLKRIHLGRVLCSFASDYANGPFGRLESALHTAR